MQRKMETTTRRRELTEDDVYIDTAALENITRFVMDTLVATDQDRMVSGEPVKYADGADGITRLATVSFPYDTIYVCQPGNKLCVLYPAGSINCTDGDTRLNFGVVGYKTALNPPPSEITMDSKSGVASETYALKVTTPGCELVQPYSFTVQRNSYVDPRQGAQCRYSILYLYNLLQSRLCCIEFVMGFGGSKNHLEKQMQCVDLCFKSNFCSLFSLRVVQLKLGHRKLTLNPTHMHVIIITITIGPTHPHSRTHATFPFRFWLDDPTGVQGGSRWLTRGMFIRGINLERQSVGLICVSNHVSLRDIVHEFSEWASVLSISMHHT